MRASRWGRRTKLPYALRVIVLLIILAAAVLGLIMLVWLFGQPPAHMFGCSSACDRCGYALADLPNRPDGQGAICPECGATLLEREQERCEDRKHKNAAYIAGTGTLIACGIVTPVLVDAGIYTWFVCITALALPGIALTSFLLANAGTRLRVRETITAAIIANALFFLGVALTELVFLEDGIHTDMASLLVILGVPGSLALSLAGLGFGLLAVTGARTARRSATARR